jgi:hypothetical protein
MTRLSPAMTTILHFSTKIRLARAGRTPRSRSTVARRCLRIHTPAVVSLGARVIRRLHHIAHSTE